MVTRRFNLCPEKREYFLLLPVSVRIKAGQVNEDAEYNTCHSSMYYTEMSARNIKIIMFLGSKVRRVRNADKLTAIYEPIV
jgi:hypothetical protein